MNTFPLTSCLSCVCVCVQLLSRVQLFEAPQTLARLCPWNFSRQEYWSGLPFSTPGDLPDPGIKPTSPVSPAMAVRFFTTNTTLQVPPSSKTLSYELYMTLGGLEVITTVHKSLGGPCVRKPKRLSN